MHFGDHQQNVSLLLVILYLYGFCKDFCSFSKSLAHRFSWLSVFLFFVLAACLCVRLLGVFTYITVSQNAYVHNSCLRNNAWRCVIWRELQSFHFIATQGYSGQSREQQILVVGGFVVWIEQTKTVETLCIYSCISSTVYPHRSKDATLITMWAANILMGI